MPRCPSREPERTLTGTRSVELVTRKLKSFKEGSNRFLFERQGRSPLYCDHMLVLRIERYFWCDFLFKETYDYD